jgi:uncharacterized protein YcfJ
MSRNYLIGSILGGAVLMASAAHADPGYRNREEGNQFDYARVIDVDPIARQVRVDTPRRECFQETAYREDYPPPRRGTAGATVLGALIGAGIGNTIGSGDGRRAATVAGAIIGGAVGHDVGERRRDREAYYRPEPTAYSREHCEVRYETSYQQRIEGYRVTYEYNGQRYVTRLPYDPGRQLRVHVSVEPAEG